VLRDADRYIHPGWVEDPGGAGFIRVVRGLPDHGRFRSLVLAGLRPRDIERHMPAIERRVAGVIERAGAGDSVEITTGLALPLALGSVAEVLFAGDVDAELHARLARIATVAREVRETGTRDPIGEQIEGLDVDLASVVRRHRGSRDDLAGALLAAGGVDDRLTGEQVVAILRLLIVAGLPALTNMIGNAIVTLVRSPSWAETLDRSPNAARLAFEELLRWDPPIQFLTRVAAADCTLAGRTVRRGEVVSAVVAAANRDEQTFRDGERVDLGRHPNPHLTFGTGEYTCPGATLARLMAGHVLGQLSRRFPRAAIVGQPRYAPARGGRALQGATLRLRPGP
jgi:cytochrome P450